MFGLPTFNAIVALMLLLGSTRTCLADWFTIREAGGTTREVEARLAGSDRGTLVLELNDGQIELVPQGRVSKRTPTDGPKPLTPKEMEAKLKSQYDPKQFRSLVEKPFVIGLVLSAPLAKSEETRTKAFLKRVGRFMKRIETVFETFSKTVRFPNQSPRYPLVVLIFETDDEFEAYARKITKGQTISASRIAGFYNGLTNFLAIRLSECHSFEVPLHEAIHQQVYNTGVTKRLSPVPKWFHEGIAAGFEGDGDRISVGPNRINKNYARRAMQPRSIDWNTVIAGDQAFRGDVLVGDAYTHAWSLHWLLVTRYKQEYIKFVKSQTELEPLERLASEDRIKQFRDAFGKTPSELQKEFLPALRSGLKRQRVSLKENKVVGTTRQQKNLADVQVSAVSRNGVLQVSGRMRNISPLRAMAYHVTVETNGGTYADWFVPALRPRQTVTLKPQLTRKLMKNSRGGPASTFRVRIRSVTPTSETAGQWKKGQLPIPIYGG